MEQKTLTLRNTPDHCQIYYPDLVEATLPDRRRALWLRRYWWKFKRNFWYLSILGPFRFASRTRLFTKLRQILHIEGWDTTHSNTNDPALNLQPGDWVEVRSLKEIFATLDNDGKLNGMRFEKEQAKFSGGRFKVYKKVDKVLSEADGKLLRVKTPTILLKEVFCDGKAHGGCDRYCYLFWREAWFKRL